MREPSDIRGVPRFQISKSRSDQLVASIVALAEQTNRLALDSAMQAARAGSLGNVTVVVEQVCRLAVGAGVAVAGMQSCMNSVAFAVEDLAERGAPIEVHASGEALRRVATQLQSLQARIQPCV